MRDYFPCPMVDSLLKEFNDLAQAIIGYEGSCVDTVENEVVRLENLSFQIRSKANSASYANLDQIRSVAASFQSVADNILQAPIWQGQPSDIVVNCCKSIAHKASGINRFLPQPTANI